jgi:hypothetical protein
LSRSIPNTPVMTSVKYLRTPRTGFNAVPEVMSAAPECGGAEVVTGGGLDLPHPVVSHPEPNCRALRGSRDHQPSNWVTIFRNPTDSIALSFPLIHAL